MNSVKPQEEVDMRETLMVHALCLSLHASQHAEEVQPEIYSGRFIRRIRPLD